MNSTHEPENAVNFPDQPTFSALVTAQEWELLEAMRKHSPTLAGDVAEAMAQDDTPKSRGWTAEERIALRIMGRFGFEGDILRVPYSDEAKSEHLSLIYDILVEEIEAGVIGLGMSERPLDELASAAEHYYIGHRYTKDGAE